MKTAILMSVEYSTISEPLISSSESAMAFCSEATETESFQDSFLSPSASTKPYPSAAKPDRRAELRIFLSTFFTIFLAELGDKTQVTTLLMSAESHAPWVVFAGAGTALVATSLIGVWLGCWLAKRVSAKTLETATGGLLLLVSVLLLWDVVHL